MSISMYDISVPTFLRSLDSLAAILKKAQTFCEQKSIEESVLLNSRLFANMFPLILQVQVATDQARSAVANLAGVAVQAIEQNEVDFAGLIDRVEKSRAYISGFSADQLADCADKPVSFAIGPYQLDFDHGFQFIQAYAIPNFMFHLTTAYNILRHNSIELGKGDFLGDFGGRLSMPEA